MMSACGTECWGGCWRPVGGPGRTLATSTITLSRTVRACPDSSLGRLSAQFQLDLPVSRMLRRAACSGGLRRPERGVAFDGHAVGVLDGAEAGGYPGLAGGDGLAVASAVGAFGQVLAVAFYFADVGFAFVGVGGEGEDGGAGGGGVQDQADGAGCRGRGGPGR